MILPIVKYGHPVLRQKGARIEKITPEIRQLIEDMIETMYEANGVGLAAQQIGQALQLTVIDVADIEDRPSTLEVNGKPVEIADFMPLVLLNPEITPVGAAVTGGEGCLSFPEMYGDVSRPAVVDVTALNAQGKKLSFRAGGLLARAVQHETDHLHGILFIDRMNSSEKKKLQDEMALLQAETREDLAKAQKKTRR